MKEHTPPPLEPPNEDFLPAEIRFGIGYNILNKVKEAQNEQGESDNISAVPWREATNPSLKSLTSVWGGCHLEGGSPGLWSAGRWFFLAGGQRQEPRQKTASSGQSHHPTSSCGLLWSHTPPPPVRKHTCDITSCHQTRDINHQKAKGGCITKTSSYSWSS